MTRKTPEDLRSHRWYGVQHLRSFGHRSRMKQMGLALEDFAGKARHWHSEFASRTCA